MIFFLSDKEVQNLIIKRSKKISSIKYILSLTNRCNLKCDYCYQSWKDEAISMPTKIIDKFIFKLLIDLNTYPEVDDIFINFFGGEPLLNKAIIYYALEKFNKIGRDLHKNFYYEIYTN